MSRTAGTVLVGLIDAPPRVSVWVDAGVGLSKGYKITATGVEMTSADAQKALALSGSSQLGGRILANLDEAKRASEEAAKTDAAAAAKIEADAIEAQAEAARRKAEEVRAAEAKVKADAEVAARATGAVETHTSDRDTRRGNS